MRRLDLLRYHDYISFIIDRLLDRLYGLLRRAEDEMTKRAVKHIINVLEEEKRSLWFSSMCRKTFPKQKVGITDLDKILNVNGNKILIEYKFRREDFRNYIITNCFQFLNLRDLAIRSGYPLYYIFEIGEYGDKWFRVLEVNRNTEYKIRRLGNGHARDTYVLLNLDDSLLLDELEFRSWLKEVMV